MFQMNVQPKLAEIRHLEAADKRYHEKYIYSDINDLEQSRRLRKSSSFKSPPSLDPRISYISNTSSNTTSGIVSDKMHCSFDESEGEYL